MTHELSALRCEHCGAELVREDLNLEKGIAVCSLCRTVLALKQPQPSRVISPPRWFSQVTGGVAWHASPWGPLGAIFFLLAWAAIPWAPEVKFVQTLGIAVIGISALVAFVRGGHVAFDGRRLVVERFGIPSSRRFTLDARRIVQLFWITKRHTFAVVALMDDGVEQVLADGLSDRDEAMFVVQELQRAHDLPRTEFPGPR